MIANLTPTETVIAPDEATDAVLRYGEKAWLAEYDPPIEWSKVIWMLMQEAAQTERSIARPGPHIPQKTGLEYHHTREQIWGAELSMAIDGIVYEPTIKPHATSAELDRFMIVFPWLAHIKAGSQVRKRRMLIWKLAHGVPAQKLADSGQYQIPSKSGIHAAKYRALDQIAIALGKVRA